MDFDRIAIGIASLPFVEDRQVAPRIGLSGLSRIDDFRVPQEEHRQDLVETRGGAFTQPAGVWISGDWRVVGWFRFGGCGSGGFCLVGLRVASELPIDGSLHDLFVRSQDQAITDRRVIQSHIVEFLDSGGSATCGRDFDIRLPAMSQRVPRVPFWVEVGPDC